MKLKKLISEQNESFSTFIEQNYYNTVTVVEDRSKKLWRTEAAIMKVIKEFQGIVTAVVLDKEISNAEIDLLIDWRNYRKDFMIRYPLAQFNDLLTQALPGDRYTDEFKLKLYDFIHKFSLNFGQLVIQGIYDQPESIYMYNMEFVLTGQFAYGEKSKLAAEIKSRHGIVGDTVKKDTHYLIVGSKGNRNYSFGNFGHKIKNALELQNGHNPIMIIDEKYFLEKLGIL